MHTRHVFLHFFLTSRLVRQNAACFWHFFLPHRFPQQALHERAQFFFQKGLVHAPFIIMLRHLSLGFKSLHCSIIIMTCITGLVWFAIDYNWKKIKCISCWQWLFIYLYMQPHCNSLFPLLLLHMLFPHLMQVGRLILCEISLHLRMFLSKMTIHHMVPICSLLGLNLNSGIRDCLHLA